jgi:hypothetical protein
VSERPKALVVSTSVVVVVIGVLSVGIPNFGTGSGRARASVAGGQSVPASGSPVLVAAPSATKYFDGLGALVGPLPQGASPALSESDALNTLASSDFDKSLTKTALTSGAPRSPATISLVKYENEFGATQAVGPDTPSVPAQLAWFAEYDNVPGWRSLPLTHPAGETRAETCTVYVVLSAMTGQDLDGFSDCVPAASGSPLSGG